MSKKIISLCSFEKLKSKNKIALELDQVEKIINDSLEIMKAACKDSDGKPLFNNMSDNEIKKYLKDKKRCESRLLPRIEVRMGIIDPQTKKGDIIQIAVLFQNSAQRNMVLPKFSNMPGLKCVAGGRTTVEMSKTNVDKSLAISFIDRHFKEILIRMGYKPKNNAINALKHRTIVFADADDTTYGRPTKLSHLTNNLSNSKSRDAIIDYLKNGGVLAIISGNDLERTRSRIIKGFSKEKYHLLSRILIIGCGGSSLCTFAPNGELVEFELYREKVLEEFPTYKDHSLDAIYVGDNASKKGNDYPAFQKIGFDRSVCVSLKQDIPEELKPNYIGLAHEGIGLFLDYIVQQAKRYPEKPLFSPETITKTAKVVRKELQIPKAKQLVFLFGGNAFNKIIPKLSQKFGPPNVRYILSTFDELNPSTSKFSKSLSSEYLPPVSRLRNTIIALTNQMSMKNILSTKLPDNKIKAYQTWKNLLRKDNEIYRDISNFQINIILNGLKVLDGLISEKFTDEKIDLSNTNLGDLILYGLWYKNFKSINLAISSLMQIADIDKKAILSADNTGKYSIVAKLDNGQKLMGRYAISYTGSSQDGLVEKGFNNLPNPIRKIAFIKKNNSPQNTLFLNTEKSIEHLITKNPKSRILLKAIRSADNIIIPFGALYSNIIPGLMMEGFEKEIAKHRGNKILLVNGNKDRETKSLILRDYIHNIARCIRNNKGYSRRHEITKYITHVVMPKGSQFYSKNDVQDMENLGIKFVFVNSHITEDQNIVFDEDDLVETLDKITTKTKEVD